MNILVTGGSGFIGMNLIKRLLSEGHVVHSIDNYSTGSEENEIPGAVYHRGDICDIKNILNDVNLHVDICFHLAAQSRVQPSFNDPDETFHSNVVGTKEVCKYCDYHMIKLVYAGSSSKHHNPATAPYSMYKYLGEEICKLYRETYATNIEICRFYNVYGPGETLDEENGNVIGIWRSRINRGLNVEIVGDGEQRRDFTHVVDIVDGLYLIAMSDERHDDAWELGTGVNFSLNELYHMFKIKFGTKCTYIPEQPGNYRKTLQENRDANEILNWNPIDRLQTYINSL